MARILIVDDHPLFREALHSVLELAYPEAETIDAPNLSVAIDALTAADGFDLVLLDLNIPGVQGFEALVKLRGLFPRVPVVVVSGHEEAGIVSEALSCGAAGFIPKSSRRAELTRAVRMVMDGAIYVPEQHSTPAADPDDSRRRELLARLASLTPQQMRVLGMLQDGLLNKQIAYELQVGETTVKAHVSEILRKLNVYSRTQAVIEMSKLGAPASLRHDLPARQA